MKHYYGGDILDVGTGEGEFISVLKEGLYDYRTITAIDLDQKLILRAREKYDADNINLLVVDAEDMPFKDNSFNTVSISNSLHHLADITQVLNEMKRVLKPGGLLIVNEMFADKQSDMQQTHVLLHHLVAEINTIMGEIHNSTFTREEIMDQVQSSDLAVIEQLTYKLPAEEYSREELEILAGKLDKLVAGTKEFASYEDFKERAADIRERLFTVGIFPATELAVLARKR